MAFRKTYQQKQDSTTYIKFHCNVLPKNILSCPWGILFVVENNGSMASQDVLINATKFSVLLWIVNIFFNNMYLIIAHIHLQYVFVYKIVSTECMARPDGDIKSVNIEGGKCYAYFRLLILPCSLHFRVRYDKVTTSNDNINN